MSQDLPVTAYALLGLLTFGDELTGYELKQRADNTLRFYWVAPATSQIYTELTRLTEHGYVEPVTTHGQGRRTTAYRITATGTQAPREGIDEAPRGVIRGVRGGFPAAQAHRAAPPAGRARVGSGPDAGDARRVRRGARRGAPRPAPGARVAARRGRPRRGVPLPVGRRRLGPRLLRR